MGELPAEEDWPEVAESSGPAWRHARERFEEAHRRLRRAVGALPGQRLEETAPGRDYPTYLMLYGMIQHALYHAGQIVLLQQAQGLTPRG